MYKTLNLFNYKINIYNIMNIINILYNNIIVVIIQLYITILYQSIFVISEDMIQGETYKIITIHVPFAWMSMLLYFIMFILSSYYILVRDIYISKLTYSLSIIGFFFTLITLVTGSLWGKPMWGTYWAWDARLTSVLILLFLYVGYIILYKSMFNNIDNYYFSSILCILGFINIPIIRYSVSIWNTLHQGSSITKVKGETFDLTIFITLMVCLLCFLSISTLISYILMKKYINEKD